MVDVRGELTAEASGVATRLTGSGSLVRWDLVDAGRLARGRTLPDRATVRRVARTLAPFGVTVTVTEGDRPLLELGSVRSRLGLLTFGSSSVRPRALWRLGRLALKAR